MAVSIGFPVKQANWFAYKKLECGRPCGCPTLACGSEATAMAFSVFDNVKEKLIGTPMLQISSGVSSVRCNYRNGEFSIHLVCPANYTALKKALILTVKAIVPHRLYAKYTANIVLLNAKPMRSEYIHVSNELVENMMLNIVIAGKLNIDQAKISDMTQAISKKLNLSTVSGVATVPSSLSATRSRSNYQIVEAKSYSAMLASDFISATSDINSTICNNDVIIYSEKKLPPPSMKMIDKYILQYVKMGKSIKPILIYTASTIHRLDTYSLLDMLRSNITPVHVKKILTDIYI